MKFNLNKSIEVLERTPRVVTELLSGLSEDWITNNEGGDTWSPFDVVGHLIHGEKTDWITRTKIILANKNETFEPFNRFAQFEDSKGKSLEELLDQFRQLRKENVETLKSLDIQDDDFNKTGIHPALGPVKLSELLSTWVAHDLGHIYQITRVMAKNYKDEIGPWNQFLRVVNE